MRSEHPSAASSGLSLTTCCHLRRLSIEWCKSHTAIRSINGASHAVSLTRSRFAGRVNSRSYQRE